MGWLVLSSVEPCQEIMKSWEQLPNIENWLWRPREPLWWVTKRPLSIAVGEEGKKKKCWRPNSGLKNSGRQICTQGQDPSLENPGPWRTERRYLGDSLKDSWLPAIFSTPQHLKGGPPFPIRTQHPLHVERYCRGLPPPPRLPPQNLSPSLLLTARILLGLSSSTVQWEHTGPAEGRKWHTPKVAVAADQCEL